MVGSAMSADCPNYAGTSFLAYFPGIGIVKFMKQFFSYVFTLLAAQLTLQLFAIPASVLAYEPSLDEIISRSLGDRSYISRIIIESQSAVFDPLRVAGDAGESDGAEAVRMPGVGADEPVPTREEDRAFRQTTYWARDKFLAVETFSEDGELLHFYLREALEPISVNISEERRFSELDVLIPYLPFIEGIREGWEEGLDRWGLQPATVDLVRATKGSIFYRLTEVPGKSVWLDRKRYYPVKIRTLVEGGVQPLAMTIEFSEFLLFEGTEKQTFGFPRTINHLLGGMLFKQTTVTSMLVNPSWRRFPLTRLRKKGRKLAVSISENSSS